MELRHPPHRPYGDRADARFARPHGRPAARRRGGRPSELARLCRDAPMMGLPLAFAEPWVLLGLLSLPVLCWLLRLIPPHPRPRHFPPTRLLFALPPKEA